jgi:hypothetical protein
MQNPPEKIQLAVAFSKAKIEWAKNHINGIEQIVKFLTSQDGYIVKSQQDSKSGQYFCYIGPKDGIPIALPLHIGDAIHNLNCVMDYLWSGLARTADPSVASKITFPRHANRQALETELNNSRGNNALIMQAFPQSKEFILNTVKPYDGPDGIIWSLNKIDNINKHRLLIPVTNIITFKRDLVIRAQDGSMAIHKAGINVKTSGPNLSIGFAAPFEFNDDSEPTISVIFAEDDPFGGEPIFETLVDLTESVTKVVQAFEEVFLN